MSSGLWRTGVCLRVSALMCCAVRSQPSIGATNSNLAGLETVLGGFSRTPRGSTSVWDTADVARWRILGADIVALVACRLHAGSHVGDASASDTTDRRRMRLPQRAARRPGGRTAFRNGPCEYSTTPRCRAVCVTRLVRAREPPGGPSPRGAQSPLYGGEPGDR